MSETLQQDRVRVIYKLKRNGRQLLVLTESDTVVLSERLQSRSEIDALVLQLTDLSIDPIASLGLQATVIPIDNILAIDGDTDFSRVDIETSSVVHRIAGWSQRPTVVTNGDLEEPRGMSPAGTFAIRDFVRRVNERRKDESSVVHTLPDDNPTRQEGVSKGTGEDQAFTSPGALAADLVQSLVSFAPLVIVAIFGYSMSNFVIGFLLLGGGFTALKTLPGPIVVGPRGITTGIFLSRRFVPWETISSVDFVDGSIGKPRILLVNSASGKRTPVPTTAYLGNAKLAEIRQAVSAYRPCTNPNPVLSEPEGLKAPWSKHSHGKPVLDNAAATGTNRRVWMLAVPLGILMTMFFVLAIVTT